MSVPDLADVKNCVCGSLRKTTRSVTQFYDQILRPSGLRSTQLSLLHVISQRGSVSFGELGARLLMDQTTVTRNIENLRKLGLIAVAAGESDARKKYISITELGVSKLAEAGPLWKQAQSKMIQGIGEERFHDLMKLLKDMESLVE